MTAPGLFPTPGRSLQDGLAAMGEALARTQPLKAKHRAALPGGIRCLSEWLTADRENLPRDYMTRPEYLAAYLRYFMPWNVYRQGRLLQGLAAELALPPGAQVVDLGAGPLTFLLALWLARPERRDSPLAYLAIDRAAPALKAGQQLFAALAPDTIWDVRTVSRAAGGGPQPAADLLVMANFLNEIEIPRRRGAAPDEDDPYAMLLDRWAAMGTADGRVLLIEPGTRPAGRRLASLRQSALRRGWRVLAPCPHANDCPQPGTGRGPWCHFTFAPTGVPTWLDDLSRKARLPKDRASLSFLLLARDEVREPASTPAATDPVRVVSEPFAVPDGGSGRYGCSARGLVLLTADGAPRSGGPAPGDLLTVAWPARPRRDRKSGALIVPASPPADPRPDAKKTPRR